MSLSNTEGLSDERLAKLVPQLTENIRLMEHRLAKSAIPEESWETAPALADARLKLALVTELLSRRAANRAGGVEVKALEWRYYPENNIGAAEWLAAQSINGQYFRVGRVTDGWRYGGTFYDDIEAAKAAAQQDYNKAILSSLEPASSVEVGEPVAHPDDIAVDQFAAAMKAKLKWEREERGRSGWQGMSADELSRLLVEHLPKGDPVDVANFCMMLWQNGQRLTHPSSPVSAEVTVTDEMVERAARAMESMAFREEFTATDEWYELEQEGRAQALGRARAALLAALPEREG